MHRQTKGLKPGETEGLWWRSSSYSVEDGCIRPVPGAELEWYDPWPGFQGTRVLTVGQKPGATQPAYQSLMELVHQLEYRPGHKRYPECLTARSEQLILDWCKRHGLLGILLSRWEAIRLAPWRDRAELWRQRNYFRGFGQVIQMRETSGDSAEHQDPRVLLHGLNDQTLVEELPRRTWSRFFPTVSFSEQDTFQYPAPYTNEFCMLYGEQLMDFCNGAKLLAGAMVHLSSPAGSQNVLAREQALDTINLLRRSVASVLDFQEQGRIEPRRVAPSLVASYADMFAQDLVYGRQTLQCDCCGTPFVSSAYQARYCSVACRQREQKRRLRKQMKEANDLRAQGWTLNQVATAVGQPRVIVKGWLAKPKKG